jgi:hypothetical protein
MLNFSLDTTRPSHGSPDKTTRASVLRCGCGTQTKLNISGSSQHSPAVAKRVEFGKQVLSRERVHGPSDHLNYHCLPGTWAEVCEKIKPSYYV